MRFLKVISNITRILVSLILSANKKIYVKIKTIQTSKKVIYNRRSEKYILLGARTRIIYPTLFVVVDLYN